MNGVAFVLPYEPMMSAEDFLIAIAGGTLVGLLATAISGMGTLVIVAPMTVVVVLLVSIANPLSVTRLLLIALPLHGFILSLLPENPSLRYWKEILVITVGVAVIGRRWMGRRSLSAGLRMSATDLFVVAYGVYMCFRIAVDGVSPITPYAISAYPLYMVLCFIVRNVAFDMRRSRSIVVAICVGAGMVALGAITEEILGVCLARGVTDTALRFGRRRASFSVGSALVMGPYMVIALGLTSWLYRTTPRKGDPKARILWLAFMIMEIATMVLSGTRAAWVQAFVSLIAYMTVYVEADKRYPSGMGLILASVMLVLSAVAFTNSTWYSRLGLEHQWERKSLWKTSLEIVGDFPIAGIGPGRTLWITSSLRNSRFVTESYLLQIVVETGLAGGALFLGVYTSAILGLLRSLFLRNGGMREANMLRVTLVSLLIGYVPALAVGQSLNAWVMLAVFWSIVGLGSTLMVSGHATDL